MKRTIALLGNPNCGKTTLFNALTGSQQKVANWPRVTVDKKSGFFTINDQQIDVIDLPGTYPFENSEDDTSQDELMVRNYLLNAKETLIINVIDASNLQRSLYLTFQLLDLKQPMMIVLNMMDVAKLEGIEIYTSLLQEKLHCPVVAISARKNQGIEELKKMILAYEPGPYLDHEETFQTQGPSVIDAIQKELNPLPSDSALKQLSPWLLLETIKGNYQDPRFLPQEKRTIEAIRNNIEALSDCELDIILASSRYEAIDTLAKSVIKTSGVASGKLTYKIDEWALGR